MKFVTNSPNKNSKKVPNIVRKKYHFERTFVAFTKRFYLDKYRSRKKKIYLFWGDSSIFKSFYKNKILWLQKYVDCFHYKLGT